MGVDDDKSTSETPREQPGRRDSGRSRSKRSLEEVQESLGSRAKTKAYEKTPKRFKNATPLQIRFRTGFIYVSITVICLLINDVTAVCMLSATAAVCAGEFYWILRKDAKLPNETIGIVAAVLYPLSVWLMGLSGAMIVTVALLVALLIWYTYWMRARISDVAVSLLGAMYTGLMLSSIMIVRQALPEPWGGVLVLAIFLSIWANDAFAYLVGSKIGKHKLAPQTSPKKSWEGFFAGLVGSMLFWFLATFIPGVTMDWWVALVFGIICGCAGVLGDLTESRIKRNVGVKDSGTIMPGHGGLLDRCDSLFLVAVSSAVLLLIGGCIPNLIM